MEVILLCYINASGKLANGVLIGKAKPDWAAQVESACAGSGLQLTRLIIAKASAPATMKTQDVTDTETSPMVRHLSGTEVNGDAEGE
jgi:hypothetical protein